MDDGCCQTRAICGKKATVELGKYHPSVQLAVHPNTALMPIELRGDIGHLAVPMTPKLNLVLFARFPVAGECKTRLIPALGPEGAAALHRRLARQTAHLLRDASQPAIVAYTGGDAQDFEEWLGSGLEFVRQVDGDLTDRLCAFLDRGPVIFFGADTPDLTAHHIEAAIQGLAHSDVVIGPAEDGGYYLIGMRHPLPELLIDMPWSTDAVFPETLRRLDTLGIEPVLLETLSDCDRPEDLARWPELLV